MYYEEFQHSEFAAFFGIQEMERIEEADGFTRIQLKTGGFQEFVDIEMEIDASQWIRKTTLKIAREWIGNEDNLNPFAKDICKSFINDLGNLKDKIFQDLVEGIWSLQGTKDEIIYIKPPPPSPNYLPEARNAMKVYMGLIPFLELAFPELKIKMENKESSGKEILQITLDFQ